MTFSRHLVVGVLDLKKQIVFPAASMVLAFLISWTANMWFALSDSLPLVKYQ